MPQEHNMNRAVLVGLSAPCLGPEETASDASLEELEALLETAGGFCTAKILQNRSAPDARTFIGQGKALEVRMLAEATGATLAVFDNALSPGQMRVLEELLGIPVLDRSALILDIFAQRARSAEGRLQVELAQYKYLLPPAVRHGAEPVPPGRRHRHPRPRGNPAGNRPPPHPQPHRQTGARAAAGAAGAGGAAPSADEKRCAGGGPGGLHQRRQVHPAQPPHRGGNSRQQPAVRHPGHHRPAAHCQRYPGGDSHRHGWVLSPNSPTIWWRRFRPPWKSWLMPAC